MSVPMISKCCCCVNLHTGTLIIGYLYIIWSLVEIAGYTLIVTLYPLSTTEALSIHKQVLLATAAATGAMHLLCSVLLLVGTYKKLACLTLPWTIVTGVLTALFFTLSLTALSLILQDSGQLLGVEATIVVVHLLRAFISVYCIVVVHSRHKEIMYEKDERRFQQSARIYKPVAMMADDPDRRHGVILSPDITPLQQFSSP